MWLLLIEFLKREWGFKIPQGLLQNSSRMILAALTSFCVVLLFTPWLIRKLSAWKIKQSIRKEDCPLLGELHHKKEETPTMGGIMILGSLFLSMLLWMDLHHIFTLILAISTFWLGTLGFIDDYLKVKYQDSRGLSAKKKMVGQALLGSLLSCYLFLPGVAEWLHQGSWFAPPVVKERRYVPVVPSQKGQEVSFRKGAMQSLSLQEYAGRLYLPFFKKPLFSLSGASLWVMAGVILFVVIGTSNAVNLSDGLDGLASGLLLIVAFGLSAIAFVSNHSSLADYLNILYFEGSGEIAIYLFALTGACLAFLWYNGAPAQIFMGDTGSLALGGGIAVAAILLKREILLGIMGGVFVAEALSVILQVGSYKLFKRRIFLIAPLHHHFEYQGWPETKIVMRFWILGLLLTLLGLATLKWQ